MVILETLSDVIVWVCLGCLAVRFRDFLFITPFVADSRWIIIYGYLVYMLKIYMIWYNSIGLGIGGLWHALFFFYEICVKLSCYSTMTKLYGMSCMVNKSLWWIDINCAFGFMLELGVCLNVKCDVICMLYFMRICLFMK